MLTHSIAFSSEAQRKPAVAYTRVSTLQQAERGIGLKAQRIALEEFAGHGGYVILAWYEDADTGVDQGPAIQREGLRRAIDHARASGIPILVDSASRISRTAGTIEQIANSGVTIVSATEGPLDCATRRASVAARSQFERDEISRTTKEALRGLKNCGVKLGNRTNLAEVRKDGTANNKKRADALARQIADILGSLNAGADLTGAEVAALLNDKGILTRQRRLWTVAAVRRPLRSARKLLDATTPVRDSANDDDADVKQSPLYGCF